LDAPVAKPKRRADQAGQASQAGQAGKGGKNTKDGKEEAWDFEACVSW